MLSELLFASMCALSHANYRRTSGWEFILGDTNVNTNDTGYYFYVYVMGNLIYFKKKCNFLSLSNAYLSSQYLVSSLRIFWGSLFLASYLFLFLLLFFWISFQIMPIGSTEKFPGSSENQELCYPEWCQYNGWNSSVHYIYLFICSASLGKRSWLSFLLVFSG